MLRLKLVTCFLLALSVLCTTRQLTKRVQPGLELNMLEKNSMVEVVEKTDSLPVDMEALFWSYFYRGSVERAGLFTGGYTRSSPGQWEGRARMRSKPGEEVMLLGEMARVSEGPRRRRREVKRAQGGKEQLEEFFSQPGWSGGVRLKHEEDNVKKKNWQRKGIFHPGNLLPSLAREQWRACTQLCQGSHPPPGFPPCCPLLEHQLGTEPKTIWGQWVDATEQFVDSHPLAVIAIQTVFSIAVINVLVSRLGGSDEADVSGRSWETEEQEEESERVLLQVLDGSWLAALEEHAMEKKTRAKQRESYICCLLNEGEEEQVECFTQPQHSPGEQLKFRFPHSQSCHYHLLVFWAAEVLIFLF